MKDVLLSLLFFLILVGVDWALVDGFRRSLLAFRDIPKEYNYKRFIFPRILVILISAVLLYVSSQTDAFGRHGIALSFVSMGIFFISSFYPQIVMFLRSKAY
jgi:hypothetical protein